MLVGPKLTLVWGTVRTNSSKGQKDMRVVHGFTTNSGLCRDCSQGCLGTVRDGFEYWNPDRDGRGFWFCRHCGSNHVTVQVAGEVIDQGDLYDSDGMPNF